MYGIFTTMKQWILFIFSKTFLKTVGIGILAVLLTVAGVLFWLNRTTDHGNYVEVPDLKLMSIEEAIGALEAQGLTYEVIDSTHYVPKVKEGAVVDQFPAALAKVKAGRAILLSTNPSRIPKYPLPTYKDQMMSYVRSKFASKGFIVDSTVLVPDLSHDLVLRVIDEKGMDAKEQGLYKVGSRFVMHVSAGQSNDRIALPNIVGLKYEAAQQTLRTYGLHFGAVVYEGEINDTLGAFVLKQSPTFDLDVQVFAGSPVDIWLVADSTLLPTIEEPLDTVAF